jgi:amino acid transporter
MAIIGIFAVIFLGAIGLSRYTFNLAKDGLFFSVFKKLDPVKKVPTKGAWLNVIP